jgi:hypothetical protein
MMPTASDDDKSIPANSAALQKRYDDAMKRRELRRAEKERLQTSNDSEKRVSDDGNLNDGIIIDSSSSKTKTVEGIDTESQQLSSKSFQSDETELDTGDASFQSRKNFAIDRNQNGDFPQREPEIPKQKARFQVYETYFEEDYDNNEYFQSEYTQTSSRNKPFYQWETYRSTSILFPPPSNSRRPKAIIHFVGGTFFGSYPRKFYGKLLEEISVKCDAVVVATPIPLVLPGKGLVDRLGSWLFDDSWSDDEWDRSSKRDRRAEETNNPLDHIHLAEAVQKEFNKAYRDVVLDEYCSDLSTEEEVEEFTKNVPIFGMGHSLGARIQAISCCHPDVVKYLAIGIGRRLIRSGRDGMVYLGFANWGASTSIPGVETLEQTVRRKERYDRQEESNRRGVGTREDVYGDRRAMPQERQRRRGNRDLRRRYGQNYDRYTQYDVDDFDLDLADVFGDVISGVAKGAKQIGAALTPDADDLEFKPSPDELWYGLSTPREGYGSCCRNTLIVQFDEDPIDQGSRLARTLSKAQVTNETDSSEYNVHDVKFARLKGGHLTPVSFRDGIANVLPSKALAVLTSSSDYLVQQLGDETSKSSRRQREELADVVDTVASYIRDALSYDDDHK